MMIEGRGLVAPSEVVIRLTPGEVQLAAECASERTGFQKYGESKDPWRRGILDGVRGPDFFGFIGEIAFAKWCNTYAGCSVSIDRELRRGGDGGRDFVVESYRFDVKARVTSAKNLIRRDKYQRYKCEAFVFCVAGPSEEIAARDVRMLGWIRHKDVPLRARTEEGRGGHTNYRVLDRDLDPMAHLVERIALAREWRSTP